MSKLFQEIIALMLYANIKFELNHDINNTYYLVRLKGDDIVWEIDDHPDDDKVYLYDEKDNRYIYNRNRICLQSKMRRISFLRLMKQV